MYVQFFQFRKVTNLGWQFPDRGVDEDQLLEAGQSSDLGRKCGETIPGDV